VFLFLDKIVKGKRAKLKLSALFFAVLISLALSLFLISGQTPELHTIQGYIFSSGSVQVPAGTNVTINATATGSVIVVQTSGPPGSTGFYSTTINALDGETVILTFLNSTTFGRNSTQFLNSPSVTRLNLTLNTRPSEAIVNITSPANNTAYNRYQVFDVTFNTTIVGGLNGVGCNATITFDNQSIIDVAPSKNATNPLGNINLGSTVSSYFELVASSPGITSVTINVTCQSDGENFENGKIKTINLRVNEQPPHLHAIQGYVFQQDNVTQVPAGTNVTINATATGSVIVVQTSGPPGSTGFYSTTINALDGETVILHAVNGSYEGITTAYLVPSPGVTRANVSINALVSLIPFFSNVFVEDDSFSPANKIDLTAGGTKEVICNGTISDNSGFSDIINVTGVFFDSSQATSNSSDDNNNHYTNSSCSLTNCADISCEARCLFQVQYYANAGSSWVCNLTGTDNSSNRAYGSDTTSINSLLALEFPDTIDFGTITPNSVSNESINNVTNMGNVRIDISLEGYASLEGDNYSMSCTNGYDLPTGYEKYNLTASNPGQINISTFEAKYKNLTSSPVNETGFNLNLRQNEAYNEAVNGTFWRIFLPPGLQVGDSCSGSIRIAAISDI
jgi:hypothetical protein